MRSMTMEEIEEQDERTRRIAEFYNEEHEGKNNNPYRKKYILGGQIVTHYLFDNEDEKELVVRDKEYYKNLREKLVQKAITKLEKKFQTL